MGLSGYLRLAASVVVALALSVSLQARDDEGADEDGHWMRRSTWELSTSLTFHRYLEPFERASSAYACRNRCVRNRRCTGWTYYDANFREAGDLSYRLQGVCVLGAGLKDRKYGSMPGRTSGVVNGEGPED
jgi:PAN domain-containing protein